MRVAAAIGVGLIAVGGALTWAPDWTALRVDGNAVGAILMILGGVGLLAVTLVSASQDESDHVSGLEYSEPVDKPNDYVTGSRRGR